jgi:hypothetical protein
MLVNRYNYKSIQKQSNHNGRHYLTEDGGRLASVTTILSATKPPEDIQVLMEWRKRVGEAKAQEITVEAAGRGTRMHSFLEDFIKTGSLRNPGTNPYSQQSHKMAKVIIDNAFSNINEAWGTEVSLYYPELYAGTTDLVGKWKGKPAIIDYKQANKTKRREWIGDYFLQSTSYGESHNKLFDTDIRTGVILICTANFEYQEFVIEDDEFDVWRDKWYDRLEQYYRTSSR